MTDQTDSNKGNRETSPITGQPHGGFGPLGNKHNKKVGPEIRSIANRTPQVPPQVDMEKVKLLIEVEQVTERANLINKRILDAHLDIKGQVISEHKTLEEIISLLNDHRGKLNNPSYNDYEVSAAAVKEIVEILDKIDESLIENEVATKVENQLLQERASYQQAAEKISLLFPLAVEYKLLDTDTTRIRNSNPGVVPFKNDLVGSFNELSWLNDVSNLNSIATQKTNQEIELVTVALQKIKERMADAITLIQNYESKKEAEAKLVERVKSEIKRFELLLAGANSSRITPDNKKVLTEKEEQVQDAKNTFNSTLTSTSFGVFIQALEDYESTLKEAQKIITPVFIGRVTTQTQDIDQSSNQHASPQSSTSSQAAPQSPSTPPAQKQAYPTSVDFEGVKADAEEYEDFIKNEPDTPQKNEVPPTIIKGNPIRPTVSGSAPSPTLEKSTFIKQFEGQKKILSDTRETLEKILPHLSSEPDKVAFLRLSDELAQLETTITTNPSKESLAIFSAKIGKLVTEIELIQKHEDMFKRDPELYKHLYGRTNGARDEKTSNISSNIPEAQTVKTTKEILKELTDTRDQLEAKRRALISDMAGGIAFGNPVAEEKVLRAEIELLDEQINKYTQQALAEITHSTLVTTKQVYSPTQVSDPSLTDNIRGQFVTNEKGKTSPLDRTKLSQEDLAKLRANAGYTVDEEGNVVPIVYEKLTEQEMVARDGSFGLLRDSTSPNHTNGMVSPLDIQAADPIENPKIEVEIEEKIQRPEPVTPENQKERHSFVSKLADTLFKFPSVKKYTWGWIAAGLSTLAISTAGNHVAGQVIKTPLEGKTLADVIKNQPSWETFIDASVPRQFIQDFSGPYAKSFDEFIKNNAPSFGIGPTNPSVKDKIAKLLCKDIYDIEGANAGITSDQQKECARIIKNLQEIMKATKAPQGVLFDKDVRFFGDLTMQEFYEEAKKVVASADAEKARLHKI